MKKIITIVVLSLSCSICEAQSAELKQLEMDIQKLAALKVSLSEMAKGYNVLSNGYDGIKNITQSTFDLHKKFLDGLLNVSPVVKQYKKVGDIIAMQVQLVQEYKNAQARLTASGYLSSSELTYTTNVYSNLFNESLKNLDELTVIITDGTVRMSDAERLKSIDRISADMTDKISFLHQFNSSAISLALQRAKEHNDISTVQSLYGIK